MILSCLSCDFGKFKIHILAKIVAKMSLSFNISPHKSSLCKKLANKKLVQGPPKIIRNSDSTQGKETHLRLSNKNFLRVFVAQGRYR